MKEKEKVLNKARIGMLVLGSLFSLAALILVFNSGGYSKLSDYGENIETSEITPVNSEPFNTEKKDIIPGNILDRNGKVLCDFSKYPLVSRGKYIDNYMYSPLFEVMLSEKKLCEGLIGKYYDVLRDDSRDASRGKDIALTIDHELQEKVYDILNKHLTENTIKSDEIPKGSAMVLDVENGEILACVDFPSFDAREPENIERYFYSYSDHIWPGSTFKVMTSIMLLENGYEEALYNDSEFEVMSGEEKRKIKNWYSEEYYGYDEKMNINYFEALERSSNAFFAHSMLNIADSDKIMTDIAKRAGIGQELVLDFGNVPSSFIINKNDEYNLASTGFGQGEVKICSVHNLIISAALINGGKVIEPHMIKSVKNCFGEEEDLDYISENYNIDGLASEHKEMTLTSSEVAEKIHTAMINNNNSFLGNTEKSWIGIKTGTAQIGQEADLSIIWIISNAEINGHKYAVVINEFPFKSGNVNSGILKEPMNMIYSAIEDILYEGEEILYSDKDIEEYLEDIKQRSVTEKLD